MARRIRGIVFLLVGCLLLIIACGWYFYNLAEDNTAGQQANAILNKLNEKQHSENNTKDASVILVDGNAFCGKIAIDRLGIELPVYDEWSYSRLKSAPCRYSGSIDGNNVIIAAHNYKSHFGSLSRSKIGDEVRFIDASGKTHLYKVCEIATIDGTAISDMQSGGWDLTLFTCTKSGEQRITVRCERKYE